MWITRPPLFETRGASGSVGAWNNFVFSILNSWKEAPLSRIGWRCCEIDLGLWFDLFRRRSRHCKTLESQNPLSWSKHCGAMWLSCSSSPSLPLLVAYAQMTENGSFWPNSDWRPELKTHCFGMKLTAHSRPNCNWGGASKTQRFDELLCFFFNLI